METTNFKEIFMSALMVGMIAIPILITILVVVALISGIAGNKNLTRLLTKAIVGLLVLAVIGFSVCVLGA
jgi:hypothetical protein